MHSAASRLTITCVRVAASSPVGLRVRRTWRFSELNPSVAGESRSLTVASGRSAPPFRGTSRRTVLADGEGFGWSPRSSRGVLCPLWEGSLFAAVEVHGERCEDELECRRRDVTQPIWPAVAVPPIRPRSAVTRWLTGLTSTKARSQPGIVRGSTKTLLAKVSGKTRSRLMLETALGGRRARAPSRSRRG